MSKISFTRRRILEVLADTMSTSTDTFLVFRDAFSDYSTGAHWMAKKEDTLERMAFCGLIHRVAVEGARESHWSIADKGRLLVARAREKAA